MKTLNYTQGDPGLAARHQVGWPPIAAILGLAITPVVLVAVVSAWQDIPVQQLTADPVSLLKKPFYFGFLSQLGIFVWASMASISLLTASALRIQARKNHVYQFFLWTGIIVLFLGLDDVFMLHEEVFTRYLGLLEGVIYTLYAGSVSWYLWRFKGLIRRTNYTLLVIALASFALSIALDVIRPAFINPYLFEDGFKFVGLTTWLAYVWQTALSVLKSGDQL